MALKAHATIVSDIQSLLGGNTSDFTSAILTTRIAEGLQEFSKYSPLIMRETLYATDDSLELDISGIKNLLWVHALEYKTGKDPRQFRNFTEHYNKTISIEIDFDPADTDTGIDTDEALDTSETGVDCDADATTAIPVGTVIRVDNELMLVSVTGTSLTVVRGYSNTTAVTHTTDADIKIPEKVYLYCAKAHIVPTLTDLAGAIDLTAGYAASELAMHIDALGTSDLLLTDMEFTISSDSTGTIYHLTADTQLASNEGDIEFSPGLAEAVANDDVITFANSSLTPHLETLLIDYVAARAVIGMTTKFIGRANIIPGTSTSKGYQDWGYNLLAFTLKRLKTEARRYQKPTTILPRSSY